MGRLTAPPTSPSPALSHRGPSLSPKRTPLKGGEGLFLDASHTPDTPKCLPKSGDHNLITRPLLAESIAASANASARIPSLAPTSGAVPLERAVMK